MNNDKAITTILTNAIENALPDIAEMALNSNLGTTDINQRGLDTAFFSFYELSENASDEYIERCVKLIKLLKKHGYEERENMLFYSLERVTNPIIFDAFYTCFTDYFKNLEAEAKNGNDQLSPVIIAFNENNIEIAEYLISKGHAFFSNALDAPHDVLAHVQSEAFTFYLGHCNLSSIDITKQLIKAVANKLTSEKSHTVILNSCIQSILGSPALIRQAFLCGNTPLLEFAHNHGFDIRIAIYPVFIPEFKRLNYIPLAQSEAVFTACLQSDPAFKESALIQSNCLTIALSKNYTDAINYILDNIESHGQMQPNLLDLSHMLDALTGINTDTPEYILSRLESIIRSYNSSEDELNAHFGKALYLMLARYEQTNHFDLTIITQCQRFGITLDDSKETDKVSTSFLNTMFTDTATVNKLKAGEIDTKPMAISILKTISENSTADIFYEILDCSLLLPYSLRQLINTLKLQSNTLKKTLVEILVALCNTEHKSELLNNTTLLRDNTLSDEFKFLLDTWKLTPYDILQSNEFALKNKTKSDITQTLSL